MMSTTRAARTSKDRQSKTQQPAQNVKPDIHSSSAKNQATAEQMRVAQLISDNKTDVDQELQKKVEQVVELTGRSKDEVVVALHDCDNDTNRAINMLLEGENDQGEWQESSKRKKRPPQPAATGKPQDTPATGFGQITGFNSKIDREKSRDRDRDDRPDHRGDGPPPRRGRQPPRLARKNKEFEENERNRNDSSSRERGFGERRGRGRGAVNGSGRGRGRGRRGDRGMGRDGGPGGGMSRGFDSGPIGTWSNETAENAEKDNFKDFSVSTWSDPAAEDWGDEWTGSLEETKVFTPSEAKAAASVFSGPDPSKVFSNSLEDEDVSIFSSPAEVAIESQVFSASMSMPATNGSALNDASNSLANALAADTLSQNSMQPSTLGQRLDLSMLLKSAEAEQAASEAARQQQSQYMSQFTKQATEQAIKNAVGIGSSVSSSSAHHQPPATSTPPQLHAATSGLHSTPVSLHAQQPSLHTQQTSLHTQQTSLHTQPSQQLPTQASLHTQPTSLTGQSPALSGQTSSLHMQAVSQSLHSQPAPHSAVSHTHSTQCSHALGQRIKPQHAKLPPPSKIPATAVEMPGHIGSFQLDVKFGNWDFPPNGNIPNGGGGGGFTFGSTAQPTHTQPQSHAPSAHAPPAHAPPQSDVIQTSFSNSVDNSSTTSTLSNHLAQQSLVSQKPAPVVPADVVSSSGMISLPPTTSVMSSVTTIKSSPVSALDSMSASSPSATHSQRPNIYQSANKTPTKDYSQSPVTQSNKMSPPEPIPFPSSQTDRKTSPHYSQRSTQSAGSLSDSNKSNTSPAASLTNYNQSGYTPGYPSTFQSQKSSSSGLSGSSGLTGSATISGSTTSTYSHQSNLQQQNLPSHIGGSSSHSHVGSGASQGHMGGSASQSHIGASASQGHISGASQNHMGSGASQSHIGGSSSQTPYSHNTYQSSSFQNQNAFSASTPGVQGSYSTTQGSLYAAASQPSSYSNQSGSSTYQTQTNYHSRDSQSSGSYSNSANNQSGSSSFSADNSQPVSSYQTGVSQSGSTYQTSSQSTSSSYRERDSGSSSGPSGGYGSSSTQGYGSSSSSHANNLQTSPMSGISTNKLKDSLSKMSVKDTALDSHSSQQYDHSSNSTNSASLTTTTIATSLAAPSSVHSTSSTLSGLTTTTASVTPITAPMSNIAKSSLPLTKMLKQGKAPPNLAQGVPPLISHNYMIGQPGMPFAFASLAAQQPQIYSYEDMQLLQQRLQPHPGYYDLPFQPPTTITAAGRADANLTNVPYTVADGNKMNRMEAQSPVQAAQTSQPAGQNVQSAATHQQTYINPALPPGYNYYYPGGIVPGTFSYTPTVYPVPPVTNTAHAAAGTSGNAQFPKPVYAGSHAYGTAAAGYDDLSSQAQDFNKAYGAVSQGPNKVSATSATTNAADLSGSSYPKTHTQVRTTSTFDKPGFTAGTPPPFNLTLPSGTQGGPMGAPTAPYGTPYMPVMTHQHSQMLHHHLQQDSTGGSSRGSQQTGGQPKPGVNKYSAPYWSN